MKKFRVYRGEATPSGKKWACGLTYTAPDAKTAVRMDEAATREAFGNTYGGLIAPSKPAPIVTVYELVPVPESEWR
jgi:hypothetical protein